MNVQWKPTQKWISSLRSRSQYHPKQNRNKRKQQQLERKREINKHTHTHTTRSKRIAIDDIIQRKRRKNIAHRMCMWSPVTATIIWNAIASAGNSVHVSDFTVVRLCDTMRTITTFRFGLLQGVPKITCTKNWNFYGDRLFFRYAAFHSSAEFNQNIAVGKNVLKHQKPQEKKRGMQNRQKDAYKILVARFLVEHFVKKDI